MDKLIEKYKELESIVNKLPNDTHRQFLLDSMVALKAELTALESKEQSANFIQVRELTDEEWLAMPKEEILKLYKNCYGMLQQYVKGNYQKAESKSVDQPGTAEERGFHAIDGLHFNRLENGAVQIIKTPINNTEVVEFKATIPDNIWGSIIVSVSKNGEGSYRWYKAMEFHNCKPYLTEEMKNAYPESLAQSRPVASDEEIEKESEKVIINYLTHNNPDGDYKESTIGADDKRIWWAKGAKAIRDGKIGRLQPANAREDVQKLMDEIMEWSDATFGEGQRNPAILHHLSKEVAELIEALKKFQQEDSISNIVKSEQNLKQLFFEYADCFMLLLDSASHMGLTFDILYEYTKRKLEINRNRKWGKPDENGVVEHID